MNEKIYKDKFEQAFYELQELREHQRKFDKQKKLLRELQEKTRSMAQLIPNKLRNGYK